MITIDFKFYEQRRQTITLMLARLRDQGVEYIDFFASERLEPNCFWVRVVATPAQLQSPTGVYLDFLTAAKGFQNGTAFEKACITFDKRLPYGTVERLIPPSERNGFLRMLCFHALPAYSRARLYHNMDLEVRRDSAAIPAEFRVELTIWQGQFHCLIDPMAAFSAFSALLRFHKDPHHEREELPEQSGFTPSEGYTEITPSTWLAPEFFWSAISRKIKTEDPNNPYLVAVHVPGHKVVIKNAAGEIIEPDKVVGGTDFYYLPRLTAEEGMQVNIFGEQLVSSTFIDGLWPSTFYIPPSVLAVPSEPWLGFTAAMKGQLQADQAAAIPKAAAAA